VAVLVIDVLDEPPDVGWNPSKIVHQADPSGFLKLPTWRIESVFGLAARRTKASRSANRAAPRR
jgi:hypothetical protein